MTQVANTVNITPNWYDQFGTSTNMEWCPICNTYYTPLTAPHVCFPTYTQTYWPPKLDPFVEFKKLYRKLIVDEAVRQLGLALENHYKDKIDKPVREDLLEYLRGIGMDIVNDEPRP